MAKRKKTPSGTKRAPTTSKTKRVESTRVRRRFGGLCLLLIGVLTGALIYFWPDILSFQEQAPEHTGRTIANTAELQIALARAGFSPGSIDGRSGEQTQLALLAYQRANHLPCSGQFDPSTAEHCLIQDPVYAKLELTEKDFKKIAPKPTSWIERGQLDAMHYNSLLEMVAEHAQSDPDFIRQLNPTLPWNHLDSGAHIIVPHIPPFRIQNAITSVRIQLSNRLLQAYDAQGQLRFHCPVSIARRVEKRPSGELRVQVRVASPNYTFNPDILTTTAEREGITEKFIIQPGPNNPVGSVWIGLNLPSYGIHGTPDPENVGRTESSGCFRLANWNAQTLLHAVWVGMPIYIEQ